MLNLLYTATLTAVTAFFGVLVWVLIERDAAAAAVAVSLIWFAFIVIFLTVAENEKRGANSSLKENLF